MSKLWQIEKVAIKLGKTSGVAEGHLVLGDRCVFFRATEGSDNDLDIKVEDATPSDVSINGQLLVMRSMYDFIRTSPIINIIERTPKYITFETESSIYTLEQIK
jgi:hypothetical protein